MGNIVSGLLLRLLLLTVASVSWSLISLVNLIAFLYFQYTTPTIGIHSRQQSFSSWFLVVSSLLVLLSHAVCHIILAIQGDLWSGEVTQWEKLIGLMRVRSDKAPSAIVFLLGHSAIALTTLFETYKNSFLLEKWSFLLRNLTMGMQLLVGISHPSWISLPYFIASCIGLVDWSMTSNILDLFWWWRYLLPYAGLNIVLLYIYQLPIEFSAVFGWFAEFIGLYKISSLSDWSETCSGTSLLLFYIVLSCIRCDLAEIDVTMSAKQTNLTEPLLSSSDSFVINHTHRSGIWQSHFLFKGAAFRIFTINFFTYGFPISLIALSYWSFQFASLYAFGLLAYVGYILYAFPSLVHLHQLNSLLLIFILFWATSTYVFNVAFTYSNKNKDMKMWETVGLWNYSVPGLYLFAQFCLGILFALSNLVNRSVFIFLSNGDGQSLPDDSAAEEKEETKVLIVATIVWVFSKCSRAIVMTLLLVIAMKPGFIHALYIIFFILYLLKPSIDSKMRQALIFLCEAHFSLLYALRLNLFAQALGQEGSWSMKLLLQLGLTANASTGDLLEIIVLTCFCIIHNHGYEVLFSLSKILQNAPSLPFGFSLLKAGLKKSAILSVYASKFRGNPHNCSSHETKIASYLGSIGQQFLSIYHSFGTYIAFLTILVTACLVSPNYISFGYLFFLLFWITGRQIMGRTRRRLWFPLKAYSIIVFLLIYGLSVLSSFRSWLSSKVDLNRTFGIFPEGSTFENIWNSLAVVIVMQLHSYERRQSKSLCSDDYDILDYSSCSFMRRLLILHSEKISLTALFYASLSPVSVFGFIYVFGLVISSTLPKSCQVPSKCFLVYSGILVMVDYLFQMNGGQAGMFPGQEHYYLSQLLGLQLFKSGFLGLECGLQSKIFVIFACMLQYVVFRWVEKLPGNIRDGGKWEEVFTLFGPANLTSSSINGEETEPELTTDVLFQRFKEEESSFLPLNSSVLLGQNSLLSEEQKGFKNTKNANGSCTKGLGGFTNWTKKQITKMRTERLQMQKTLLSFALLNAISLLYVAALAACILLSRQLTQKLWPAVVFLFALILILEYLAVFSSIISKREGIWEAEISCRNCWRNSQYCFDFCLKCWLGVIVDDHRVLISYWVVFMLSCFKLRADQLSNLSMSHMYQQLISLSQNTCVLSDLSFETKSIWTYMDYLRLESYCHLLDFVLSLILLIGTLEYDILHLGYLGFALVFFRMRLQILKKKDQIFRFLRVYNFAVIVLSLAYQSPFLGSANEGKCDTSNYIYEMIGFYKYDYGFRITSRSALVEIIIFALISLQSYMFASKEFDCVSMYLEAEQDRAIHREQEKKASWRTKQLLHIRRVEELKYQRNMQVEKIKAEVLNLQTEFHSKISSECGDTQSPSESLRWKRMLSLDQLKHTSSSSKENSTSFESLSFDLIDSPSVKTRSPSAEMMNHFKDSLQEITEQRESNRGEYEYSDEKQSDKIHDRENLLRSAVQLIGDGVSQVQSLGNLAVNNLVNLLNIDVEELISEEKSDADEFYDEIESQHMRCQGLGPAFSMFSDCRRSGTTESLHAYISMLLRYIWSQIRSHNDIVCYCCFILIFLWNFSLLSMVYTAALFLYALCVHAGPNYMFWVVMLIYTEFCVFVQYFYQIIIQHCGSSIQFKFLHELGFPEYKVTASFVTSNWPLFLVYLFTLLQSAITTRDSEGSIMRDFGSFKKKNSNMRETQDSYNWLRKIENLLFSLNDVLKLIFRCLYRYWKALTEGAETPPYFVQLSMSVEVWPEDGISQEKLGSRINKLLKIVNSQRCKAGDSIHHSASKIRVQSIEQIPETPNIALVVLEVLYASPLVAGIPLEWHQSLTPAADVAEELLEAQRMGLFDEIGFPYHVLSVIWGGKREIDLYAYVFCADLAVFYLVAIFYESVIKNNTEFLEVYQLEDQFPKEFVLILLIIFSLIVLDRVIYLCMFPTGKVIFYIFNLALFTFTITKYAWSTQPPQKSGRFALRAIYLTKIISLALQAVQIRYSIPNKGTLYQQFLTSSVSRINFLAFRVYRALPFLHELRCVLDWSCTTTSLTMYDWLKLEDIHAMFLVKCDADLNRAQRHQGERQTRMTKFCNGVCLFFVLICVIWAPMLMYSSGNPTNIANLIKDASVRIDLKTVSGKLTLFETTLCEKFSWTDLGVHVDIDPHKYLSSFDAKDVQLICCQADASSMWLVPPVVQSRFVQSVSWGMYITFTWQFVRDRPKGKEVVLYELLVEDLGCPKADKVMEVLNGTTDSFDIYNIFPRYFRVTGSGDVRLLEETVEMVSGNLTLHRGIPGWWSFKDMNPFDVRGFVGLSGPIAIVVSEETPQGIIGDTLSHFSIWGLYITFVLAVGRFFRLQCADLRMRIPFENLPSSDRLLALCENIYTARAEGELKVEEVLYWTLVKIYRSPHMLLEYTKSD
ncbi:unnamed protein product [Amaranthus hypochondriacus]